MSRAMEHGTWYLEVMRGREAGPGDQTAQPRFTKIKERYRDYTRP